MKSGVPRRELLKQRYLGGAAIGIAMGASASAAAVALIWLIRRPDDPSYSTFSGGHANLIGLGAIGAVLAVVLATAALTRWRWPGPVAITVAVIIVGVCIVMVLFGTVDPHLNFGAPRPMSPAAGVGASGVVALCLIIAACVLGSVWTFRKRVAQDRWAFVPAIAILATVTTVTAVVTGPDPARPEPTAVNVTSEPVNVAAMSEGSVIAAFTSADGDVHVGPSGIVTVTRDGLEMRSTTDGTTRWRMAIDLTADSFVRAVNDTIVLNNDSRVIGVDIKTGAVLWSRPESDFIFGKVIPEQITTDTVESSTVLGLLAADGQSLRRIDERSGRTDWVRDVGQDCSIRRADVDGTAFALSQICSARDLRDGTSESTVNISIADGSSVSAVAAENGDRFGDGAVVGNNGYRTNARIVDRNGRERRNLGVGNLQISPDRSVGLFFPYPAARPRIVHADARPDTPVADMQIDRVTVAWSQSRAVVYSGEEPAPATIVDITTGRTTTIDGRVTDAAIVAGNVVASSGSGQFQLRKAA